MENVSFSGKTNGGLDVKNVIKNLPGNDAQKKRGKDYLFYFSIFFFFIFRPHNLPSGIAAVSRSDF